MYCFFKKNIDFMVLNKQQYESYFKPFTISTAVTKELRDIIN